MDWADDVTYAVHDIEDFYRAGLIPLDRLGSSRDDSERQHFYLGIEQRPMLKKRVGILDDNAKANFESMITGFPLDQPYSGTTEQRSALRNWISMLIGEYIAAFTINPLGKEGSAQIDSRRHQQVKILKALTWHYVIHNPALAAQQFGQRKMIRELLKMYVNAGTDAESCTLTYSRFRAERIANATKIGER